MDTQTHEHIDIGIDLRDSFQAGTDSDLCNRLQTGDDERHREMSRELNSGFAYNESTPRGSASLLFPLMQYGHIFGYLRLLLIGFNSHRISLKNLLFILCSMNYSFRCTLNSLNLIKCMAILLNSVF